jgi:hypothetical protein
LEYRSNQGAVTRYDWSVSDATMAAASGIKRESPTCVPERDDFGSTLAELSTAIGVNGSEHRGRWVKTLWKVLDCCRLDCIIPRYRGIPNPGAVGSNPAGGATISPSKESLRRFMDVADYNDFRYRPLTQDTFDKLNPGWFLHHFQPFFNVNTVLDQLSSTANQRISRPLVSRLKQRSIRSTRHSSKG